MTTILENALIKNRSNFHPVVDFDPVTEKLFRFNFTDSNTELSAAEIADTALFSGYVIRTLQKAGARFGIGGYKENRKLYRRSDMFAGEEVRSIHLGVDIWGPAGTVIYAPWDGKIHSFANNDNFGDYGATIILSHRLESVGFLTLYGHLSLADINGVQEGDLISKGEPFAHFGTPADNGNWPPHVHFQIIYDMGENKGDYPGVCKQSETAVYTSNCPDADLILNMMNYLS